MRPRALTERERSVLDALLSPDFPGVEDLRRQARDAVVVGRCACGCPSVDFARGRGQGMRIRVNAGLRGSATGDGLFFYTIHDAERGEVLGGIEWVGQGDPDPAELPEPHRFDVEPA